MDRQEATWQPRIGRRRGTVHGSRVSAVDQGRDTWQPRLGRYSARGLRGSARAGWVGRAGARAGAVFGSWVCHVAAPYWVCWGQVAASVSAGASGIFRGGICSTGHYRDPILLL